MFMFIERSGEGKTKKQKIIVVDKHSACFSLTKNGTLRDSLLVCHAIAKLNGDLLIHRSDIL